MVAMEESLYNPVEYAAHQEALQALLDKLKKNVEGVGGYKILKSKYPTAYRKLFDQISAEIDWLFKNAATSVLLSKEGQAAVPDLLKECKHNVSQILFHKYSAADAVEEMERFKTDLVLNHHCLYYTRPSTED